MAKALIGYLNSDLRDPRLAPRTPGSARVSASSRPSVLRLARRTTGSPRSWPSTWPTTARARRWPTCRRCSPPEAGRGRATAAGRRWAPAPVGPSRARRGPPPRPSGHRAGRRRRAALQRDPGDPARSDARRRARRGQPGTPPRWSRARTSPTLGTTQQVGRSGCFTATAPLFVTSGLDSGPVFDVSDPPAREPAGRAASAMVETEATVPRRAPHRRRHPPLRAHRRAAPRAGLARRHRARQRTGAVGELVVVDVTDPAAPTGLAGPRHHLDARRGLHRRHQLPLRLLRRRALHVRTSTCATSRTGGRSTPTAPRRACSPSTTPDGPAQAEPRRRRASAPTPAGTAPRLADVRKPPPPARVDDHRRGRPGRRRRRRGLERLHPAERLPPPRPDRFKPGASPRRARQRAAGDRGGLRTSIAMVRRRARSRRPGGSRTSTASRARSCRSTRSSLRPRHLAPPGARLLPHWVDYRPAGWSRAGFYGGGTEGARDVSKPRRIRTDATPRGAARQVWTPCGRPGLTTPAAVAPTSAPTWTDSIDLGARARRHAVDVPGDGRCAALELGPADGGLGLRPALAANALPLGCRRRDGCALLRGAGAPSGSLRPSSAEGPLRCT